MNKINLKFWNELERDLQHAIPDNLKYTLAKTGYETRFGLQHITNDDILDIEDYIAKNEKNWLKSLTGAHKINGRNYFKYLPGEKKNCFENQ